MRESRFRTHDDVVFMKFRQGGPGPEGFGDSGSFRGGPGPAGFGGRGQFRGGFGPGFGPGFGGPGRHGRGRRRRGDVRLALLLLLQLDGPRNGYQLMQALADRSDGRWQPSPGSVYPALSQLEDEGLVSSTEIEGQSGRTFKLTDAGQEHLTQRGEVRPPWEPESETDDAVAGLRRAMIATVQAVRQVGADGDAELIAKAAGVLEETRRQLYRLLAGDERP